jgi:GNAT superfamily N-acetyltransferase
VPGAAVALATRNDGPMADVAPPEDEIRFRVEAPDTEGSRAIVAAFVADLSVRYPELDAAALPSPSPDELRPPNGAWVVVRRGEQAVGCGGIRRLDGQTGEIKRVYLDPSVRGRGLAARLIGRLEDEGRALGWRRVRLDTGDRQPEALALYLRLGYRRIDDYNGNHVASYWLEREL